VIYLLLPLVVVMIRGEEVKIRTRHEDVILLSSLLLPASLLLFSEELPNIPLSPFYLHLPTLSLVYRSPSNEHLFDQNIPTGYV